MEFEPVVALADGQARTYEALGVDTTALDDIAREVATWPPETRVAVHVGLDALGDPAFVGRVLRTAGRHGIAPQRFVFAIEEQLACDDFEQTEVLIDGLAAQHVYVGIDRFGSASASLRTLARFPIDFVKIDWRSVPNPDAGQLRSDLVAAIVAAAKMLCIDTVVDGVESLSTLARVIALDCDYAQGPLFGGHGPARQIRMNDLGKAAPAGANS